MSRVYRHIRAGSDGGHFFSYLGARRDADWTSVSDERQRDEEKWPRPFGLRRKSRHTLLSPLTLEPPKPAGSAASGAIFARNAAYLYMSIDPEQPAKRVSPGERGLTLVELIVTITILSILAGAAYPIARFQYKRQQERELHYDLWMMRDAIDKYKDAADKGAFQTKVDSQNYPPDLQTLVDGVDVQGKKLRFLRHIPIDPITGNAEWGLRSMQDDPDSDSYGGQSVFDVYSKSQGTGLDGTKYSTW